MPRTIRTIDARLEPWMPSVSLLDGESDESNESAVPIDDPTPSVSLLDGEFDESGAASRLAQMEKMRAVLKNTDFSVPGIAVIGGQSSGKSSVLNSLTGLSFPRGDNLCTIVPTIVSLVKGSPTAITLATDADFETNVVHHDPALPIEEPIRRLTSTLSRQRKIVDTPIYIRYVRPVGAEMTLIDIPGVTCQAESQHDIEEATIRLTRRYASKPNMIVLCVLPGGDDFHNSKALQVAMEQEGAMDRLVGVVTKVDCLPKGTDILAKMNAERPSDISLVHGYVAVRNLTLEDERSGVTLEGARSVERELFERDEVLHQLRPDQRGITALAEKVVRLQSDNIDRFIPAFLKDIDSALRTSRRELALLPAVLETDEEKRACFDRAAFDMTQRLRNLVRAIPSPDVEMNVAARADEAFDVFGETLQKGAPNFLASEYGKDLVDELHEHRGFDLDTFLSSEVFRAKSREALEGPLRTGADALLDTVHDQVSAVVDRIAANVSEAYPKLGVAIAIEAKELLAERRRVLDQTVAKLVEAELAGTFTKNHYLTQTIDKFEKMLSEQRNDWNTFGMGDSRHTKDYNDEFTFDFISNTAEALRESYEARAAIEKEVQVGTFVRDATKAFTADSNATASVRKMQVMLRAYHKVVKKRIADTIPCQVRLELLFGFSEQLHAHVMKKAAHIAPLIEEQQAVAVKRNMLRGRIATFEDALAICKSIK